MNRISIPLFFFLFLTQPSFGQTENIVVNENFQAQTLQEILQVLEQKYACKLTYEHEAIQGIFITKKIKKKPLKEAIASIFEQTPLDYELLQEKQLLIRKKRPPKIGDIIRLYGRIIDKTSQQALAYATIFVNKTQGTESDDSGAFVLEMPFTEQPIELSIQYVGYETQTTVIQKEQIYQPIHIQLATQNLEIASVTIVEQTPAITQKAARGEMTVDVDALNKLPAFAGGNDVFRNLQMLPGISAHDDLSANLSIRGSNGDENMMVMDGITLYNVGHYFGIFSAINPNLADKVTVYKNAFPVEYGGRTAGVVDIKTNELSTNKAKGGVELNLLTSNLWLELPLSKNMGLLIGGRITNKDIADTPLFNALNQNTQSPQTSNNLNNLAAQQRLTSVEPDFRFYDINAKWAWEMSPKTKATLSFFRGFDRFNYSIEEDLKTRTDNQQVINRTYNYTEEVEWYNQGGSLQVEQAWTSNFNSKLTLSNSFYLNERGVSNTLLKERFSGIDTTAESANEQYNGIHAKEINLKNNWMINDQHLFTFGYNMVNSEVNVAIEVNDREVLKKEAAAQQHSLFLQHKAQWGDKWDVQLGLRNTYYTQTKQLYWSPRISMAYAVNESLQLKGSWSYYNQFLRQSYHEDRFGRTFDFWVLGGTAAFPVANSKNTMLGLRYLNNWLDVDVELYQKKATGVIEHALQVVGFDGETVTTAQSAYKVFSGKGLTRGVDILLKKTSGNYTGWIAYTLSKSTNSFPDIRNGATFPAQNDRRHQLKVIQQYQWKKWDFSATYVYSSGRPYTDLSILSEMSEDRNNLRPEDRISYLESYQRMDIGANYNFLLWSGKAKIGASIFNLLNRKNVKYRQYVYTLPDRDDLNTDIKSTVIGTELEMLGFTPNVTFSVEF